LLTEPLNIQHQVSKNGGHVLIPDVPGHGAEPNREFLKKFTI
jgi:D-galactarolactone cycloisomerase